MIKDNRFNLANRLLHWAIAFVMLFLLLTVFLRTNWMSKTQVGDILYDRLKEAGTPISREAAIQIGKDVRRPMWQYHTLAGYVLIGLYMARMALMAAQGITFKNPFSKITRAKDKFKAWVYIAFYALLAVTLFTGYMVVNGPKTLKHGMESVHVQSLYYVVIFIALHIAGVLIADARTEKGLISKMVSGHGEA